MARVLLIRLSSLGDLVQELPIGHALHAAGHELGYVVEERFAALFGLVPFPVAVLAWRRGIAGTLALRGAGRGYDAVVDLQGNWKSALVGLALAGTRVHRAAKGGLREPSSALVPSRHVRAGSGVHVLERSWHVVREALGLVPDGHELPEPPLLRPPATGGVDGHLEALGLGGDGPVVACLHGPARDPRSWPAARALALEAEVEVPVVHVVGPRERDLALPPTARVLRQEASDPAELAALGAVLVRRGGAAVGHDGGAMHLLRACGARTLFLFGPQDPARTGPRDGVVLQAPVALPCRPCLARRCRLPEGNRCMQEIGPREVGKALSALLAAG